MLASRDRRPRGHPASGRLDRAFCRSAGTFPSWEAGRRADEPIDPERSHADPGSTSTCAGGRGPARLLPPRLPALPSPAPPCGDNECRESVTRSALRRPSSNLQIRRFQCGHPGPFISVRDLGLVAARCSSPSGGIQDRSSVWLPAWLPSAAHHHALVLVTTIGPLPGAVTALCPAQTPPPNPAAAEPYGRRVLSRGGVADHEAKPRS
jgi:hypothetical protein